MEPHTGHLDGRDYLKDIQEAHMKILAEKYDTDIMVSTEPWLVALVYALHRFTVVWHWGTKSHSGICRKMV
jgi:hypothetical protein